MTTAHLHSYRVAKVEVFAKDTRRHLSDASGFFCAYREQTFLVTNWHVVTGRHFQTHSALHPSKALPGSLRIHAHISPSVPRGAIAIASSAFNIALRNQDMGGGEMRQCWLEHPQYGSDIDVVAIPVDPLIADCTTLFRIDLEDELAQPNTLAVMDQAFVTGYPLSATTTPNSLPIYKSGTIASEPHIFNAEPRIYIDGKTKTGMSGSPVVVKRDELASPEKSDGGPENNVDFIGVYSGRERQEATEFEAELGIVWPYRECLLPILDDFLAQQSKRSIA